MQEPADKGNSNSSNVIMYSGIGFQIAGTTALGTFIGYEVDKAMHTSKLYFTLGGFVLFLALGFYIAFKLLLKNK